MTEQTEALQRIRGLFQEERQQALQNAREAVKRSYGPAPTQDAFAVKTASKYPMWFEIIIALFCFVVLAAAFLLSAMRLHHAGYEAYLHGLDHKNSAAVAGYAIVVLAEATQLISTVVLAKLQLPSMQRLLYMIATLATAIAIVGNIYIATPDDPFANLITWKLLFMWLEAIAPPLIVLGMAHVLKHQMLDAIEHHHANNRAYEDALENWQAWMKASPEEHPQWQEFCTTTLQDAIRRANSNLPRTLWSQLTREDWIYLLRREMSGRALHEELQAQDKQAMQKQQQKAKAQEHVSGGGGGNATGKVVQAMQNAVVIGGMHTVVCPVCNYKVERATELGATRALAAHSRKHRNEQKANVELRTATEHAAITGALPDAGLEHIVSVNGTGGYGE